MGKTNIQRGFTIVELLIVIIVIGVIAAITLVVYNGVRSRATIALLQSELTNSAKAMEVDKAVNNRYATTPTAANDGKGLPIGKATAFQYRSTATTYCITATNGGVSYMISDTLPLPTAGGCPGDPVNGNIANLATNPGFEANAASWAGTYGTTPIARVTSGSGIVSGSAALEVTMQTWNQSGAQYNFSNLQTNTNYVASAYVTLISGDSSVLQIRVGDGSGTRGWNNISSALVLNQPVRVSLSWQSSATNPSGGLQIWRNGTAAGTGIVRIDNFMITQGSTLYNYADGTSANWAWNGAVNNSTSTGPPL